MKRLFILLLTIAIFGCKKKGLDDNPGYMDLSGHVKLFGFPGELWMGHDIDETLDGVYVATGVRDFAGDSMKTVVVLVNTNGDSLGVFYINERSKGTNIVALPNGDLVVENGYDTYILDRNGNIKGRLNFSFTMEKEEQNNTLIYDAYHNALLTLWGDSGLCIRQVFLDGSNGWITCSNIDAFGIGIKLVDGGYVAVGSRRDGILMFKVDTSGNLVWKTIVPVSFTGGLYVVPANAFEIADNGDFLISGEKWGEYQEPFVMRVDSAGNIKWFKTYLEPVGDLGKFYGYNYRIVKVSNGEYMLVGDANDCNCIGVISINDDGNVLFARKYLWAYWEGADNIIKTRDGNLLMVGMSAVDSTIHFFIFKLDPNGNPVW